ncbi:MAG: ribosome silencing factor [Salibacteraceae bacterium]
MSLKSKKEEARALAELAVKGIQEKKGLEIIWLDLKNISNAVTDYFIICHGTSNTHVDSLADSVEDEVRLGAGEKPWHKEGVENAEWVLLDFVDVVVHIFQREAREFYKLEELWADAERIELVNEF